MDLLALLPADIGPLAAAALVVTALLTAAVTASFGLGGGVLLLVVLLTVMPPAMAIPVHAIVQTGANASRSVLMRAHVMRELLLWFIPGSLVGVALASLLVVDLPVRWLTLVLALFILWTVWAPRPDPRAFAPRNYVYVGASSGFLTMFLGVTGPLVAVFLSPVRYGRLASVATHAVCMTMQNLMKITAFALIGFSIADWAPLVVLMLAAGSVGSLVGRGVLRRLPESAFRTGFRWLMTVLALRMLFRVAFPA